MTRQLPMWCAALALTLAGVTHAADGFQLSSTTVAAGASLGNEQVYNGFGCSGKNVSPALHWSGAPTGTKGFALTVYDPDAPTGSGWWHWVVYDIPANATDLAEGAGNTGGKLPAGAQQGKTDFGTPGYGGPCPPTGDKPHHYIFTLYALKTDKLGVSADSTAALIGYMINANKLGKASFTALYGR